jgi:hypothetical protein
VATAFLRLAQARSVFSAMTAPSLQNAKSFIQRNLENAAITAD